MLRSRFRRTTERVFKVDLTVHQLDSIPSLHRLLYVHWHAKRAVPCEGRTPSLPVEPGNVIRWNSPAHFTVTIPSSPTDASLLQPSPLTLHLRSDRRTRWLAAPTFANEGTLRLDLSDLAAVGSVSKNFLLQDSLLNATLNLSLRVVHHAGDRIFRTRALSSSPPSDSSDLAPDADPPPPSPYTSDSLLLDPTPPPAAPFPRPPALTSSSASVASAAVPTAAAVSAPVLLVAPPDSDPDSNPTPAFARAPAANLDPQDSHSVLQSSIPDPALVQRHIYEQMFQARVRDAWPPHIEQSRVDATEHVNHIYARVCAADGIGLAAMMRPPGPTEITTHATDLAPNATAKEKTLSLEALLESRNTAPQRPTKTISQMPLARTASTSTPLMSVRSNSMGEIIDRPKLPI